MTATGTQQLIGQGYDVRPCATLGQGSQFVQVIVKISQGQRTQQRRLLLLPLWRLYGRGRQGRIVFVLLGQKGIGEVV